MKNDLTDFELDNKLKAYMKSGRERAFILDEHRVFENNHRSLRFINKSKVAAAAVLVLLISAMAVPQVSAVIRKLFTFIPGVGIVEKKDTAIYAMKPVTRRIEPDTALRFANNYAFLENAIYTNGCLKITVKFEGKNIIIDDYTIYKNDVKMEPQNFGGSSSFTHDLRFSGDHDIWTETEQPTESDLYEIEINGYSDRLAFTLDACTDYYELASIGPTDIQNDISITAVASKNDDKLTVWCYPINTTGDRIVGIGDMIPSLPNGRGAAYIETQYGFSNIYTPPGRNYTERLIFYIPVKENSATLHIPSLTLIHDEKKKITVNLPEGYVSVPTDISVEFSIGTVRISEIERKPKENDTGADSLRIGFEFEDAADNIIFRSFRFDVVKGISVGHMGSYNKETGRLDYIETDIGQKTKKITFTISDLCYYLLGEYVIPIDVN